MIVVDTSVWVDVLRSPSSPLAATLASLIDEDSVAVPVIVRSELLAGTTGASRERLERNLAGLPILYPTEQHWRRLDEWTARTRRRGETFSLLDLMIGVLAEELGAVVWSLDTDFRRLGALGLVQPY